MKLSVLCIALLTLAIDTASADLTDELDDLVGYTIIDSKTVAGWYDDEEMEESSFEDCEYDRVIMFTDDSTLTCSDYNYDYAHSSTKGWLHAKNLSIESHQHSY